MNLKVKIWKCAHDGSNFCAIKAIDFPRRFIKRIAACFFFPDGSVGIFSPLVAVAVAFPERGLLGGGVEVEVATDLSWDGGGTGIVFTQQLPGAKDRGEQ